MIHIHFWIPAHNIIPFLGIDEFRKRVNSINDVFRQKEPKFTSAFTIELNVFLKWQKAVDEAMDVFLDLDMTTLEIFKQQGKNKKSLAASENYESRKKAKL